MKLVLAYGVLLGVLIGGTWVAFYAIASDLIQTAAVESLRQLAEKTASQVDLFCDQMDKTALYVLANPTVAGVFMDWRTAPADRHQALVPTQRNQVEQLLVYTQTPRSSATRISLYNARADYIGVGKPDVNEAILRRLADPAFAATLVRVNQTRGPLISAPHPDWWADDPEPMLSLYRNLYDLELSRPVGVVEVQERFSHLVALTAMENTPYVHVFLFDSQGNQILPPARDVDARALLADASQGPDPVTKKRSLFVRVKTANFGWPVLLTAPMDEVLAPSRFLGFSLALFGVGLFLVSFLIVLVMTRRLTQPLVQLTESVRRVSIENLAIELTPHPLVDELDQLSLAFDQMFSRLKRSMDQVVALKTGETNAQLSALQARMNPHFIHNVLSTIIASASEDGNRKVQDLSNRLSRILRYTVDNRQDKVTMAEELDHVRDYLELMQARFEDQLQWSVTVGDPRLLRVALPKLTLQPLVENCFEHGFKTVLPPWLVTVDLAGADGAWTLTLNDNGAGIPAPELARLRFDLADVGREERAAFGTFQIGGLGLLGVFVRLNHLYGSGTVFSLENGEAGGTRVTLGGDLDV